MASFYQANLSNLMLSCFLQCITFPHGSIGWVQVQGANNPQEKQHELDLKALRA